MNKMPPNGFNEYGYVSMIVGGDSEMELLLNKKYVSDTVGYVKDWVSCLDNIVRGISVDLPFDEGYMNFRINARCPPTYLVNHMSQGIIAIHSSGGGIIIEGVTVPDDQNVC